MPLTFFLWGLCDSFLQEYHTTTFLKGCLKLFQSHCFRVLGFSPDNTIAVPMQGKKPGRRLRRNHARESKTGTDTHMCCDVPLIPRLNTWLVKLLFMQVQVLSASFLSSYSNSKNYSKNGAKAFMLNEHPPMKQVSPNSERSKMQKVVTALVSVTVA